MRSTMSASVCFFFTPYNTYYPLGVYEVGCILSSWLFNLYTEYIMRNAGLDEAQAGLKIAERNINTSDMQMTPPLWQKVKKN